MTLFMVSLAMAKEPLDAAVLEVTTSYATCQKASKNIYDPGTITVCEKALSAVGALTDLLKANPNWPQSKTLPASLRVYDLNLTKALSTMRQKQAYAVTPTVVEPITNGGGRVVAVEAEPPALFVSTYYDKGSTKVRPRDEPLIQEACSYSLSHTPDLLLEVRGYSDSGGSPRNNMRLSVERAESVTEALSRCGVSRENILTLGYGGVAGDTEEDKARNRRVDITLQEIVPSVPNMTP